MPLLLSLVKDPHFLTTTGSSRHIRHSIASQTSETVRGGSSFSSCSPFNPFHLQTSLQYEHHRQFCQAALRAGPPYMRACGLWWTVAVARSSSLNLQDIGIIGSGQDQQAEPRYRQSNSLRGRAPGVLWLRAYLGCQVRPYRVLGQISSIRRPNLHQ